MSRSSSAFSDFSDAPEARHLRRADPHELQDAVALICAPLPDDARVEQRDFLSQAVASGQIPSQGVWIAEHRQQVVAALLTCPHEGRLASIYGPARQPGEPPATCEQLHAAAVAAMPSGSVALLQATLLIEDRLGQDTLTRLGYRFVSDLVYMVATTSHRQPPTAEPLQLEACPAGQRQRLASLITRTYQGSLDCPELDGLRSVDDVLTGYAAGQDSDQLWFIATSGGEDVGCLLLADHPEQQQWELVYMGLVPEARGRGWGHGLAGEAMRRLARSNRRQMVVAVDQRNVPAQSAYRRVGFIPWTRRRVLVLPIHETSP